MRQEGTAATEPGLGEAFVAIYDRAFLIGPGFFAGVANGMILGYRWNTRLRRRQRVVER
jgi:hypothetical protein